MNHTEEQAEAFCLTLFEIISELGWTSETATPDDGSKIVEGVRATVRKLIRIENAVRWALEEPKLRGRTALLILAREFGIDASEA